MSEPLRRAAARSGEALRPDFDEVFSRLVPALLLHRILVDGATPDPAFLERLVDRILLPLLLEP